MDENKTKPTKASVDAFINSLPEPRRADARVLVKLMQSVSRQKPTMWGSSLIGFGSYQDRYESGREGDMPLLCFSPRKSASVLYLSLAEPCPKELANTPSAEAVCKSSSSLTLTPRS